MFRVKDVTSEDTAPNKYLLSPRYKVFKGENQMTGTGDNAGKASFGAGCFWGVEAAFRKVKGVISTAVGYMGGSLKNPTYEQVCSGETGHAEVVQVTYDPAVVSFDELLTVFWSVHNPTQVNRQGPDIGSNYRSVIFFHDTEQERIARKSKVSLQVSGRFGFGKIVTQILPASEFWRAEEYHQQYFEKHSGHGACGI
jgi:peptide-methionine (S)-S-oxide reductase